MVGDARYRARAEILKAMAHPSRLRILEALSESAKCVCELQEIVGSDMSTISKHLSLMRAAGLLKDERKGQQVFYRLRVPCILSFFGCVETVLALKLDDQRLCSLPIHSSPALEGAP